MTVHRVAEIRSNLPRTPISGEKPTLLANYCESKMKRSDYSALKRKMKEI